MEKVIETLKWLFDGIGTEAIGIAIGLIIPCGVRGYYMAAMHEKPNDSKSR